jgi:hypothetical protein
MADETSEPWQVYVMPASAAGAVWAGAFASKPAIDARMHSVVLTGEPDEPVLIVSLHMALDVFVVRQSTLDAGDPRVEEPAPTQLHRHEN